MNIQRDLFPNKPIPILAWPRPTYYDNSGTFPNYISTEQIPHSPRSFPLESLNFQNNFCNHGYSWSKFIWKRYFPPFLRFAC